MTAPMAYDRDYYEHNKEKWRDYGQSDKAKARRREHYQQNKEKLAERNRLWRQQNKEWLERYERERREQRKEYNRLRHERNREDENYKEKEREWNRSYRERNREELIAAHRKWYDENRRGRPHPRSVPIDCACGCGGSLPSLNKNGGPQRFLRGHRQKLPDWRETIGPRLSGKGNPNYGRRGALAPGWKGGTTPERQRAYRSDEWNEVKRQVRKRDGRRCSKCGITGTAGVPNGSRLQLHVHHIKSFAEYPELRFELSNLTTLCHVCHHEAHRGRKADGGY